MRTRTRTLALPLLLLFTPLAAQTAGQPPATLSVQEVRPGMKGQGRTVFHGGKIERFSFEVLGLLHNNMMGPGRSVILVKCIGENVEQAGVLAGMSGSPCYIDGKLIGALSLGFPASKEAIAGITPIGEMLDQLKELPGESTPLRTPLLLPKLEPPKVLKSALKGEMIPLARLLDLPEPAPEGAQRAPFALFGTELNGDARALWSGAPVQFVAGTASAAPSGQEASPLEPGGMMAINLVQGDLDLSAAGTITYVSGKRVLLFGHQLFNLGALDLPLWSASVAASISSYQNPTKLVQAVAPVGALRLDRSVGVAGVLGAEAKLIPMRIGLNLGGRKTLNFRFELMDHPVITPFLAATIVAQTLPNHVRGMGFQSLAMQGNIKLAGHPPIQVEYMLADLNSGRMAQYVGALVQAVTMNPFERPVIEGISLTIKAEERLDLTFVSGVRILKARARRGEVLPVLVTLQNVQGVRETATFNVNIPPSAHPGKATLLVGDGLSLIASDPDERNIDLGSLGDIVRSMNGALRNNLAYSLLVQQQPGAGLRGSRIEGIPPTIGSLLTGDGDSAGNRLQRRIVGRAILPLEREVKGLVSLDLDIE